MSSQSQSGERAAVGTERVAAWLVVVLAVAFAVAVLTGPGATVATNAPDATFDGTYDSAGNVLIVEHTSGDTIQASQTSSLVVVIADDDTDISSNVSWVTENDVASFPVEPGDSIRIDDATVDADGDGDRFDADATVGFELDRGDRVRVVWRGRPFGAPGQIFRTLADFTV